MTTMSPMMCFTRNMLRSHYEDCADLMDRMGDLAALKYKNFEDLMRSSDYMLFAFALYKRLNSPYRYVSNDDIILMGEIHMAADESEERRKTLKEELKQEMSKNGRDNLIRKMYEFFNTNMDLNRVWGYFTIYLTSSDEEVYEKNEADGNSESEVLKHREDDTISRKSSDQEVYKKDEAVATSESEVLKHREDDTISPKSSDQEVYRKNEAVAISQLEVLKQREDDTISPKSSDQEVYEKNEAEGYPQEGLKIDPESLNRYRGTHESPKATAMVNYTRIWASTFRSDYKDCANLMDRMGDFSALKYENFEDLMSSSDSMLLAFTLCKEMNYPGRSNDEACLRLEIEKAAATVESETRKEELRKALEQEVSENGRDQLIRKMYEFFNTKMDLDDVWMCSDREAYKKNEAVGTSGSEVLEHRKDGTILLKSYDGVVDEMNKAAATSGSKVLKHVIEETGSRDPIPLPLHSSFLPQFIALLEMLHDLQARLQGYKESVKEFLHTNRNKLTAWHRLFECLKIQTYSDLTSLFFCRLRSKVGWESKSGPESELQLKSRRDFSKYFAAFESNSKHFLQAVPYKRKHAISNLRRSAAFADIPGIVSLCGLTLQDVERKMECAVGYISECFATLVVA